MYVEKGTILLHPCEYTLTLDCVPLLNRRPLRE